MNAVTTTRSRTTKPYPNSADRQYYLERLTDGALAIAVCVGIVSILFFLVTMF